MTSYFTIGNASMQLFRWYCTRPIPIYLNGRRLLKSIAKITVKQQLNLNINPRFHRQSLILVADRNAYELKANLHW